MTKGKTTKGQKVQQTGNIFGQLKLFLCSLELEASTLGPYPGLATALGPEPNLT